MHYAWSYCHMFSVYIAYLHLVYWPCRMIVVRWYVITSLSTPARTSSIPFYFLFLAVAVHSTVHACYNQWSSMAHAHLLFHMSMYILIFTSCVPYYISAARFGCPVWHCPDYCCGSWVWGNWLHPVPVPLTCCIRYVWLSNVQCTWSMQSVRRCWNFVAVGPHLPG